MLVIPAIDILGGRCVRLTQGDYDHPVVYADDPVEVARHYVAAGAKRLHVVDLDAARGSASNMPVIARILELPGIELQVAGGLRTEESVDALLGGGARWVVMATAPVRDPHLFERCTLKHQGQVLAALDVRDNKAAVSGWRDTDPVAVGALVSRWEFLPLGGVILTQLVPYFEGRSGLLLWLAAAYLFTLALEIVLILAGRPTAGEVQPK